MLPEYADIIKRTAGSVEDVETSLFLPNAVAGQIISAKVPGYETDNINIVGATPNLSEISPHEVESGRYYSVEEDARGAHVAMLGHDVAYVLYPDGRAVGNTFMMDGAEYTVVGVFAKAKGGFFGQNGADTQITIPLKTAEIRYPQVNSFNFSCKAKLGRRKEAYDEVQGIMRRIPPFREIQHWLGRMVLTAQFSKPKLSVDITLCPPLCEHFLFPIFTEWLFCSR